MKILTLSLLVSFALGLVACDDSARNAALPAERPTATAIETPPETASRRNRAPSMPRRPKVFFGRMGAYRTEVEQAIADLKLIGVWHGLSKHLYRIDVMVRPGRSAVKADRHLADARFWRAPIARGTFDYPEGRFCWIRFFPAAMDDDLARWRGYYGQGLTGLEPPSDRQFWAGILGHELSHCPRRGAKTTPEHIALAWENRILDRLRRAGVE